MVKAFLTVKKSKQNGKTSSFVQIRKYNDAILYGAKSIGQKLPLSYYSEMDKFLAAYTKEVVTAKEDGILDETEADPIPLALFWLILEWALENSNIFLWVFTILQ